LVIYQESYLETITKFVTLLELLFLEHDKVHLIVRMLEVTVPTELKIIEKHRTPRWNRPLQYTTHKASTSVGYKDYISQIHHVYFSCLSFYMGDMFRPRLGHH